MHRIDSDGHSNNRFVDEDVNNAIPGTTIASSWLNAIQEELVNILIAAGINPSKTNDTQLARAFELLGGSKKWDDITGKPNLALAGHNHNGTYYTEQEVNSLLAAKAAVGHNHNGTYYTEQEVSRLLAAKAAVGHNHNGTYYTEQEVNNLLNAKSPLTHKHDGDYHTKHTVNNLLSDKVSSSQLQNLTLAGATMHDVTSIRSNTVTYTNNYGRLMLIVVSGDIEPGGYVEVNGIDFHHTRSITYMISYTVPVLPGQTYSVNFQAGLTFFGEFY